jgi:hypothetical protein
MWGEFHKDSEVENQVLGSVSSSSVAVAAGDCWSSPSGMNSFGFLIFFKEIIYIFSINFITQLLQINILYMHLYLQDFIVNSINTGKNRL